MKKHPGGRKQSSMSSRTYPCANVATMSRTGTPIAYPQNPYLSTDRSTIDITTGVAYPAKAERARRDPRVGLLFWDPTHSGLTSTPLVLVKGLATVKDADLQANTDRYLGTRARHMVEFPLSETWYWPRIWTLIAPLEIWSWTDTCSTTA
jgi:hypothetical protein